MILTAKDIAEITRLLDESHFSELRLEIGDFKLRISRGGARSRARSEREPRMIAPSPAVPPEPVPAQDGPGPGEADITAPLPGNFYHAPRPGHAVFVKPGDRVADDSTIGIIEVMKLMNPIRAGVSGVVVEILAEDGKPVEEGQALVRVKVDT